MFCGDGHDGFPAMPRGRSAGWSSVELLPFFWVIDLFCGNEGLVGGVVSVRYDVRVSSKMFVWLTYVCQVEWTRVDDCVGSLGSLRCGVFAVSRSVVLRVSMLVRSWRSEAYCPLFGSLTSIAYVFRICSRVLYGESLVIVRIVLYLCVPVAHKGLSVLGVCSSSVVVYNVV
jgi:hypothetical protein